MLRACPAFTAYIDGVEVRPGVRITDHGSNNLIRFEVVAVCEQDTPEQWRGEVVLGKLVLLSTSLVDDCAVAQRLARRELVKRFQSLVGDG